MRGVAIAIVVLAGCSFEGKVAGNDVGQPGRDANDPIVVDAAVDAPAAIARPLFAASGANLYTIDLAAQTSVAVGPISRGTTPLLGLDGLAFDGTNLIGLDKGGGALLVIDPTTAKVTASKTLLVVGLGGLTVIPANEIGNAAPIVLAASDGSLCKIAPATGQVTILGDFSTGLAFSTDLAWVHGHGLYITLTTGVSVDVFQIDPANGSTIADLHDGYDNMTGLSGYHDQLWAVSSGGFVYSADLGTGALTQTLMDGPSYTEAAE